LKQSLYHAATVRINWCHHTAKLQQAIRRWNHRNVFTSQTQSKFKDFHCDFRFSM